jgi:hypothetical protein
MQQEQQLKLQQFVVGESGPDSINLTPRQMRSAKSTHVMDVTLSFPTSC